MTSQQHRLFERLQNKPFWALGAVGITTAIMSSATPAHAAVKCSTADNIQTCSGGSGHQGGGGRSHTTVDFNAGDFSSNGGSGQGGGGRITGNIVSGTSSCAGSPDLILCSICNRSDKIVTDPKSGEIICSNCGMVISDKVEDTGQKW